MGLGVRKACSGIRKGYSGKGAPGVISSEEAELKLYERLKTSS